MADSRKNFYRVLGPPVRLLLKLCFRVRVVNPERLPAHGPAIVCPNHASYIDPLVLSAFSPRPVRYMMLRSYYEKPFLRLVGRLFGCLPVDDKQISRDTLRQAEAVLRGGELLGIFPEGGRSSDGKLMPARPGAVLIAMRQRVPVVPVAIRGAFEAFPRHRLFPRPGRITILFGEPLTDHLDPDSPRDKGALTGLTGELMERIERLLEGPDR